jgi:galactose-1-phosphate uridylyltransferase
VASIAGFELGTGYYINPVLPEEAAESLRRADPSG